MGRLLGRNVHTELVALNELACLACPRERRS